MPRTYDNSRRAARAAETRRRIVDAAIEVFRERGYAGARMAEIAERASVSVDTVNVNGPKSALLQAAVEVASFGQEGEHLVFEFDLGADILRQLDADALARLLAEFLVDLNERVGVLWTVLTAEAIVDEELAARHEAMLASIIRSTHALVRLCEERGWTSGDLTHDQRVATLLTIGSIDSYRRVRHGLGFDADSYREWLRIGIVTALRT